MNRLFGREVYIRLSEDGADFVSTTKYGRFFSRVKKFALDCRHEATPEDAPQAPVFTKRRLLGDEADD